MVSTASADTIPSAVSSSPRVIYSGISALTTGWQTCGVATVTSPAPERSAPSAASRAAPVFPVDPATISTRPQSPLWMPSDLGTTRSRAHSRVRTSTRRPVEGRDHRIRNPDVGDHHLAGPG